MYKHLQHIPALSAINREFLPVMRRHQLIRERAAHIMLYLTRLKNSAECLAKAPPTGQRLALKAKSTVLCPPPYLEADT